jgi:hypothetical protein
MSHDASNDASMEDADTIVVAPTPSFYPPGQPVQEDTVFLAKRPHRTPYDPENAPMECSMNIGAGALIGGAGLTMASYVLTRYLLSK